MAQNDAATREAQSDEFSPDEVPDEEWFRMTTPRVRAFVESVYENARGQDPEVEVLKAGDTGVMFQTRYEGGCVGRDFWATVEDHGFQVADLNSGSGKILVRDRTRVDD